MSLLQTFNQTRKRIRQKPTIGSLLVVLMLFGLFLEAYMHNFNLVYIVLFFVFALAFIAAVYGIVNLTGLHLYPQECDRLFAKETSHAYLSLYTDKKSPSFALTLACMEQNFFIPMLHPARKELIALPLTPTKRGTLTLETCQIESRFPLNTARLLLPLPIHFSKTVYPQPKGISLEAFLSRRRGLYGEESDFDGISEINGAAPMSKIHWASAAKGVDAIKKFAYEIPLESLLFDFYTAGNNDESRLSQLTRWVIECEAQKRDFKIRMPDQTYDSKRSGIETILKTLALY